MITPKLNFKTTNPVWTNLKLSDVVNEIYQGLNTTSDLKYTNKGIPFLQAKHITSGFVNYDGVRFLDAEVYSHVVSKYTPKKNDLLFTNRGTIGKVLILESDVDFMVAWNIMIIKIQLNKFNPYLIYLILSELERKGFFELIQTGNATKFIGKDSLLDININLPIDKGLQNKLSEFFKYLNKKIQLQQEKIDLLKEQKKGFMQKIFSQELRFKDEDGQEFPEWEKGILSDLVTIIGGGTPDSQNPSFWEGEYQWYTPTEINQKYSATSARTITKLGLEKSSAKLLPVGTILLTSRATLGEMSILLNEGCTNQGFQSLVPKEQTISEFIYALQPQIKKYCYKNASGSTFLEISKSILEKMPIMIPTLKEQIKIAKFSDNIDKLIQCESDKLKVLENQKQAFMQQMFI